MIRRVRGVKTHIFLNQVGYLPDRPKIAAVVGTAKSFSVCSKDTGEAVLAGTLSPGRPDAASGDTVLQADFSALTRPGQYYLRAGSKKSPPFSIGSDIYEPVRRGLLKSYYLNRCGTDLPRPHAGAYARKKCHMELAALFSDPQRSMDVRGGWHDGGEYGRSVYSGALSLGFLLYAGLLFPESFGADLTLPESGNGVPDLFNECRYELEWLLKMQDKDGGLYSKAETATTLRNARPSDCHDRIFVHGKTPDATAAFAAVAALASRAFRPLDTIFSNRLKSAAERAWIWVLNYAARSQSKTAASRSREGYDDLLFWASAEMYRLTGEAGFHRSVLEMYEKVDTTSFTWNSAGGFGSLAYIFSPCAEERFLIPDKELQEALKAAFMYRADNLTSMARHSGYNTAKPGNLYLWGSNMDIMAGAVTLLLAAKLSSEPEYENTALEQLHYVLGKNPMGISYITGFGTKSCLHPCHLLSTADGIDLPVPGLLVGGPDMRRSDEYSKWLVPKGTPPAKCYVDREYCFSANEASICWNAPAVFAFGFFVHSKAKEAEDSDRRICLEPAGNFIP